MKRFAAHRLHRFDALEVKTSPAIEGLSAHTVPAAHRFKVFAGAEVVENFQADFVSTNAFFHFAGTKKVPRATEVARG